MLFLIKLQIKEIILLFMPVFHQTQNKSNLESQAKRLVCFCNAKGWQINQAVKECASGLNDNWPKLLKLLKNEKVTCIVRETH